MKLLKNQKGFTLLEILVVISIIGILIVLGATAFSVAQQKGRDARRRGDLKSMQTAFEQFYAASGTSEYDTCENMEGQFSTGSLPTDPKGGDYPCLGDANGYCACADLDDSTGGNATNPSCNYGSGEYFCVSNLQ
jgi:prepilin-type N-terminal cleavage/methylation domain-containing protein